MSQDLDFRSLLVQIVGSLSEADRRSFHFILGEDVPRPIRENTTLGGTYDCLESLFDQCIISDRDFQYLIDAFERVPNSHVVMRLKDHKLRQRRLVDKMLADDDDKITSFDSHSLQKSAENSAECRSTSTPPESVSSDEIRVISPMQQENHSRTILIIREGHYFGSSLGGAPFDDARDRLLTINETLVGIKATWSLETLITVTFIYSNGVEVTHGTGDGTQIPIRNGEIMLQSGENIIGVNLYTGVRQILNLYRSDGTTIIVGLQFHTDKNRDSGVLGLTDSARYSEVYPDYRLAFVRGRSHGYIDALQFVWYKSYPCSNTTLVSDILK